MSFSSITETLEDFYYDFFDLIDDFKLNDSKTVTFIVTVFVAIFTIICIVLIRRNRKKYSSKNEAKSFRNKNCSPNEVVEEEIKKRDVNGNLATSKVDIDSIGEHLLSKMCTICGQLPKADKWTFAAIVVKNKYEADFDDKHIICFSTSNEHEKRMSSVKVDDFSPQMILSDVHSAVLAKRAFMRFLEDEIEKLIADPSENDSLLTLRKDSKGYCLKEQLEVYYVLSDVPCGFKQESDIAVDDQNNIKKNILSEIRESKLSKTCFDKIIMWSFTGLQGSVLSNCLDAIPIHNIVFLNYENAESIRKQFESRYFKFYASTPRYYKFVRPKLHFLSSNAALKYQNKRSTKLIRNWIQNSNHVEVIDVNGRKDIEGRVSRLCDAVLYDKFTQMKRHMKIVSSSRLDADKYFTYRQIKNLPAFYVNIKKQVNKQIANILLSK